MSVAVQRTRRRQQREETRGQILLAAQEFLAEHSYRELSVDALMSRTGHTRTVFYRHFDDIPALVLSLIAEVGGELVEISEQWIGVEQTGPEEARRQLGLFVDFYVRNGRQVRAVAEASHHDEAVHEAYTALIERFVTLTADAMGRRVAAGEIAPVDAPEIACALVWMLNGYLLDRLGHAGHDAEPERVLETVWTVWTRTVFPTATA
jgi:AcrR family transcriptional regulator